MPNLSPAHNSSALTAASVQEPEENAVREYAYRLYQQGNGAPGHDVDDWLEATACLKANIPSQSSHRRLHEWTSKLVSSPAMAKREMATLRRGREILEAAPMPAESDMQTSVFDHRP
jgi:hypothetical protein